MEQFKIIDNKIEFLESATDYCIKQPMKEITELDFSKAVNMDSVYHILKNFPNVKKIKLPPNLFYLQEGNFANLLDLEEIDFSLCKTIFSFPKLCFANDEKLNNLIMPNTKTCRNGNKFNCLVLFL